jgi:cytochrome c2
VFRAMNRQQIVLLRDGIIAALVLSLCGGTARAQQSPGQKATKNQPAAASGAALDRMIAAGKSQRELAQYLFDTHGCKDCHTIGSEGKLGFTLKGKERAEGFEGCISTLKAMSVIAKVPENQRSATQRRRAQRFEEFGCATCHKLTPGKMGLTEVGAKLAHLHLGCVEVEKLLASSPAPQR